MSAHAQRHMAPVSVEDQIESFLPTAHGNRDAREVKSKHERCPRSMADRRA